MHIQHVHHTSFTFWIIDMLSQFSQYSGVFIFVFLQFNLSVKINQEGTKNGLWWGNNVQSVQKMHKSVVTIRRSSLIPALLFLHMTTECFHFLHCCLRAPPLRLSYVSQCKKYFHRTFLNTAMTLDFPTQTWLNYCNRSWVRCAPHSEDGINNCKWASSVSAFLITVERGAAISRK